jgi:hypothetical protein
MSNSSLQWAQVSHRDTACFRFGLVVTSSGMSAFSIAGLDNASLATMARRRASETLAMASWSWALAEVDWVLVARVDFEDAGIGAKNGRVGYLGDLTQNTQSNHFG